nr:hypothetical protein CFP56_43658 [Quercus suber]
MSTYQIKQGKRGSKRDGVRVWRCERSGEEDAELQCKTKKVKEGQASGHQQVGREEGAGARAGFSYKASLVGDIPGAYAQAFKFQANEEEEPFSDEKVDDPSEGFVAIKLSKRTKDHASLEACGQIRLH